MSLKLHGEVVRACVAAPIAIIVCAMAQQSVIGQPPPPTVHPNGVVEGRARHTEFPTEIQLDAGGVGS